MICQVYDLGLLDYDTAWELQARLAAEIAAGERPPTLLLLEHPHVYTFGRRGREENLLWDESELRRRGIAVRWVDRGGDVTYHGPGQLVGYPLLPLGRVDSASHLPQADYVGYLRRLEQTLILALARLGLETFRLEGKTGVWVQREAQDQRAGRGPGARRKAAKVAAIGVKVDARGVSRHGFALNVHPDMSYWEGIIACGLVGHPVTSLAELLPEPPDMARVKAEVITAFGEVFNYEIKRGVSPLQGN